MSITYPPEMLPKASEDEDAEVIVVCTGCNGTGHRLARLTKEQDYSRALSGQPIPKVQCWYCDGTGKSEPSEVTIRRQRDEWR